MLDLLPDEDQAALVDAVGAWLEAHWPLARLRANATHGGAAESAHWRAFAELGVLSLALPHADGGSGTGPAEQVLVLLRAGRHLPSPTLLATLTSLELAVRAGQPDLVHALARGLERVAPALVAGTPRTASAVVDAGGCTFALALSAESASLLPIASMESAGAAALDDTLHWSRAVLAAPVAELAGDAARSLWHLHRAFVAALATGIAETALQMAVSHVTTREQFGQPLGGFQAVKHQCADMAVRAEAARALTCHAALVSNDPHAARATSAAAARLALDAAIANARANVHLHGAMGFTAEGDAHWLLKRAQALAAMHAERRGQVDDLLRG